MARTGYAAALAGLVSIVAAVPAQAGCWRPQEVAAAKVRDLDAMLMVSALRCRHGAADFLAAYNQFVTNSRPALAAANLVLRGHYASGVGPASALDAYDRFTVRLANRYGGGVDGLDCADMASILEATASEGASIESLAAVAERAGMVPPIDDVACPVAFAALER